MCIFCVSVLLKKNRKNVAFIANKVRSRTYSLHIQGQSDKYLVLPPERDNIGEKFTIVVVLSYRILQLNFQLKRTPSFFFDTL